MAEDNENRRATAQRRPSGPGKGTGKVTAGHGGSPRRGAARPAQERTAQERPAVEAATPEEGAALHAVEGMASTRVRDRKRLSEKMGQNTRMRLWLQSSALDFLLVLVVSVALVYTVSYGFYSAEAYRGNILLLTALIAPLLLILFAGSWSKRAVPLSALGAVVLSAAYIGVATAISPDPALFADGGVNDVAGNYTIFALVLCVTTVVTYLLSRRTVGLVFLLIFGVLACGIVQFMWREWIPSLNGIAAFVGVFLGVGMLFVYQCYRQSVYSANRVKKTSFTGAFAYSALIGVVCVAVGAGVFGIIGAIAPDTFEFKPLESHVSPPVDESSSRYDKMDEEDDRTTDQTNDEQDETDKPNEGGNYAGIGGLGILESSFVQSMAQAMAGYDPNDPDQDITNIAYLILTWELVILGLLLFLVVLAIVLFWRYRRALRLKRIASKSPRYQVWYIYTFLIERFRRLKLAKPDQLTPLEFAVGFSKPMLPFTRGTDGVDFVEVSSVYQDAVFGDERVTDDSLDRLRAYYKAFFKNARQYVGLPKWVLWKFWRM